MISRRALLASAAATGALAISGCTRIGKTDLGSRTLEQVEGWNLATQRALAGDQALARTFPASAISRNFKANGTLDPGTTDYNAHRINSFADWRLVIDGLVDQPQSLSLAQLKAMRQRTQITRHDCVEGWSAIGQWTGVELRDLLRLAGLQEAARFVVFHCADSLDGAPYYESIDLIDALHPQTLIAHSLNDAPLPVGNGAPLRLRVERQLGYKHAKYIERIEAVDSLDGFYGGKGGYWEDRGYQWYAGI